MEYRKLGELNPPFVLSPRTLFDYRQAILLFKPAFYPTRSPPPVHQTPPFPPPLSRIFKVGAVHTVITIKPRSRPPFLPYIYPPSRYLRGLSGTIKRVCAIAIAIVVAREKGRRKRSQEKSKKEAQKLSEERGAYPNARSTTRLCARSTFLSSLFADPSVLVARSVGEKKRSVRRARRTRGGRGSRKRDTDRSVRERNPRLPWLPSHSRLASLPWKRLSLSLRLSLFHLFRLPSVRLPRPPGVFPSLSLHRCLSRTPPPSPASLTPRFSPSSRQLRRASLYLSGSFAHILSPCSLGRRGREGRRDKEERAREIGREKREGKERMRDTPRRLPRTRTSPGFESFD